MADMPTPIESAPVGAAVKAMISTTIGGVALAIVGLISSAISSYGGGDLTPMTQNELTLLIMLSFGWFLHSKVATEDRAAFHQWVLSRFGYHPTALNPVPPPPSGVSPMAPPQRSAAELLRQGQKRP